MDEFISACGAALPGVLMSCLASGLIIHYLRTYIDRKLEEEDARQAELKKTKVQRSQLEMQRRQALGKVIFWLHHGLTKPPPNGELEAAMKNFEAVEKKQHELEQSMLAGLMVEEEIV